VSDDAYLSAYRGRPVIVLGASGFIGRWVARLLTEAGAQLTLPVRDPAAANPTFRHHRIEGRVVALDLLDPDAVGKFFAAQRPVVVFNLAVHGVDRSERNEPQYWRLNRDLVSQVAEAVLSQPAQGWTGARIVHAGSALEYGSLTGDLAEDGPAPRPFEIYGQSKLAGTEALKERAIQAGQPTVTGRLFYVYGPGEHSTRLLPGLIAGFHSGKPVALATGNELRDFTYVADVAQGLLRVGAQRIEPGLVVNIATGNLLSIRDFVTEAARVLPLRPEQLRYGEYGTHVAEMSHRPVAVALLQRLTGWKPLVPVSDGIQKTIAFGA
jgi:nucleoside-diphosphate-sugar epimerase